MPVRINKFAKLITREYLKGTPIRRTALEWEKTDKLIADATAWNEEVKEMCDSINLYIQANYNTDGTKVVPVRYKKLDENLGNESKSPRNYLSFEGVTLTHNNAEKRYYIGRDGLLTFAVNIKDLIDGKFAKKEED